MRSIASPSAATSRGGTMYPLEGGIGFVELLKESAKTARGKRPEVSLVAYFLRPDATSTFSPPTDAKIDLDNDGSSISLSPQPGKQEARSTGRLASAQGPYGDEIQGRLTATLDGRPITVKIAIR